MVVHAEYKEDENGVQTLDKIQLFDSINSKVLQDGLTKEELEITLLDMCCKIENPIEKVIDSKVVYEFPVKESDGYKVVAYEEMLGEDKGKIKSVHVYQYSISNTVAELESMEELHKWLESKGLKLSNPYKEEKEEERESEDFRMIFILSISKRGSKCYFFLFRHTRRKSKHIRNIQNYF